MLKNSLDAYVMSTRVRLARNLAGCNFMSTIRRRDAERVEEEVGDALERLGFTVERLCDLSDLELEELKERHLISPALIANRAVSAIARRRDSDVSVMINEEDHLRIQCIKEGLELQRAFSEISALDDELGKALTFSFDAELGFLTACPTNLGTGMRAGIMMFLPGLRLTDGIEALASSGVLSHMTFRGLYGEGSDAEGYFYQLSNRHTLGLSEQEILQEVKDDIDGIAAHEERARDRLYEAERVPLTDRIGRAWGALTNSYVMTSAEFCTQLAFVRLGVGLGILKLRDPRALDRLMIECRPATLAGGKELSSEKLDILRAERLREALNPLRLT